MGKYQLKLKPTSIPKSKILKDQQKAKEEQLAKAALSRKQL